MQASRRGTDAPLSTKGEFMATRPSRRTVLHSLPALRLAGILVPALLAAGQLGAAVRPEADPPSRLLDPAMLALAPVPDSLERLRADASRGDADAQARLGARYYEGRGVARDLAQAFDWYRKAAEQGDVESQTILGLMYQTGAGVQRDAGAALAWLRRAAGKGDPDAQARLGEMFYQGDGVSRDFAEARQWLHRAAVQGDAGAQAQLGAMCYLGDGEPRDVAEAFKWLQLASRQDDPFAQGCLGLIYAAGDGVPRDPVAALGWLLRAEAGGNQQVRQTCAQLTRELSPEQLAEGRRRAQGALDR